jgi:hypothetical protein
MNQKSSIAHFINFLTLSLLIGLAGCHQAPPPAPAKTSGAQAKLPTAKIDVGGVWVEVEVADTFKTRERGYMFRDAPKDGEGMLFVWPSERYVNFWMQNTQFDIDLGYIAADGTMFQILRMKAFDNQTENKSRQPAMYALEVAAGWFEKHGLKEGVVVRIPPEVKSAEDDPHQ